MASADEEEDCSRQLQQPDGSFVGRAVSSFAGRTCHRDIFSTAGDADVFEVGWTDAADAVECSSRYLELNQLGHRQPLENITHDW